MKKLILKKYTNSANIQQFGYKIAYSEELNTAQYEAVMHDKGPALVIAGAGTGKTRTLVYRLARLIEDKNPPESILLLTFTRKAASEMLRRASSILDGRCEEVSGGTFHSFALQILRKYAEAINFRNNFSVLDSSDSEDVINILRSNLKFDKTKRRFPTKTTIYKIISMARNTREKIEKIIEKDYPGYEDVAEEINLISIQYREYKAKHQLMDYDDLLVHLLNLMKSRPDIRKKLNDLYRYIMVDEYQDTNRLQHEIVLQLAGDKQNIMAVGDDAQSIYAFRGADYQNILFFPKSFDSCVVYKIEQNYRSTTPILDLSNEIIKTAAFKYEKELYSDRIEGDLPIVVATNDEREQSDFVAQQILEYREQGIELADIAVLFRSSFHSFDLEISLAKSNIPYQKFGGIRFAETAHIKDLLAFFKVLYNPYDAVSWTRLLLLHTGIGPASASKIVNMITSNEISLENYTSLDKIKGKQNIRNLFSILSAEYQSHSSLGDKALHFCEYYKPILSNNHDDWRKRWKDLETFVSIAGTYKSLASFLNDMAIDPPTDKVDDIDATDKEDEILTLSTIHSAKGLEWKVVFLIWALEGRFPSARSLDSLDSVEEERRLFYVACTRAKDILCITYPMNIFDRESGSILSRPSRFLQAIDDKFTDKYIISEE